MAFLGNQVVAVDHASFVDRVGELLVTRLLAALGHRRLQLVLRRVGIVRVAEVHLLFVGDARQLVAGGVDRPPGALALGDNFLVAIIRSIILLVHSQISFAFLARRLVRADHLELHVLLATLAQQLYLIG